MTIVVDSSTVVAALVDDGPDGDWALDLLDAHDLVAPQLVRAEAGNVLRRAALAGTISDDVATLAFADLLALAIDLVDFDVVAERVWSLRMTTTVYDAWHVAIAEATGVPLATLDGRLSRAPGLTCAFLTPPRRARR